MHLPSLRSPPRPGLPGIRPSTRPLAWPAPVRDQVGQVLRGKPEPVALALVALLSGGHLLVEDVPGVGKTLLAKALARSVGGVFRRVQCTPDLLPSELTGVSVFHLAGNEWEFRPGPLFAHVVLVDELNRATPRTQSALLEAMEERQVTVDGVTHALPQPVLPRRDAEPVRDDGTFPLVEGQLDRFSVVTHIGPPDPATERQLLLGEGGEDALADLAPVSDPLTLADAIATVRTIHCAPSVADYVIAIANATRDHPDVAIGASPRASLALLHAAQAHALLAGRSYVVPDDVKHLASRCSPTASCCATPATLREAQTFLSTLVEGVAVPHP